LRIHPPRRRDESGRRRCPPKRKLRRSEADSPYSVDLHVVIENLGKSFERVGKGGQGGQEIHAYIRIWKGEDVVYLDILDR